MLTFEFTLQILIPFTFTRDTYSTYTYVNTDLSSYMEGKKNSYRPEVTVEIIKIKYILYQTFPRSLET